MDGKSSCYLGLGSNIGDRQANLIKAVELLAKLIELTKASSIYETDPWGYEDQRQFLNCVCVGETSLTPQALMAALKETERLMGRQPTFQNGPRLIDIDLLFYGNMVIREPGLEIPHPRMAGRAFVLVPLAEIDDKFVHPALKLTVEDLLQQISAGQRDPGGLPDGVYLWGLPIEVAREL